MTRTLLAAGLLLGSLAVPAEAGPAEGGSAGVDLSLVEEVVTSAEKRPRQAARTGGAISTVTGNQMQARRQQRLGDLAEVLPNVDVKYSFGNQNPVLTVRGVGLNDFNANNNPPVGVYVDGGYLPSPYLLGLALFDIDRVEVLRGPQGSLHGRNTTAGALSVFSRRPTLVPDAGLEVSAGSWQRWGVAGHLSGPLGDTVQGRLAFTSDQAARGPFQAEDGSRQGDIDSLAMRGSLALQPFERTEVLLQLSAGRDRSHGWHYGQQGTANAASDDFCAAILAGRHDPNSCFGPEFVSPPGYSDTDDDLFTGSWSQRHRVDNRFVSGRLLVDQGIGELQLTAITAWEHFARFNSEDADVSPAQAIDVSYRNTFDVLSQELLLQGEQGRLAWSLGGYLSRDHIRADPNLLLVSDDLLGTRLDVSWVQRTRTAAVFSSARWALAPAVDLVGGLRLNWEDRTFRGATTDLNPFAASGLLAPGSTGPVVLAATDERIDDVAVTGRLALEWQATEALMWWLSLANGFKSGGFTGSFAFSDDELAPFDRERVTALEAGVKLRSDDGQWRLDLAGFTYDYIDLQLFTTQMRGDTPVFTLSNAANAQVRGLEAELRWQPAPVLDLRLAAGWLHTEIKDFRGTPDLSGNRLPNAPAGTVGLDLTLRQPLAFGWAGELGLQGAWRSRVFKEVQNLPYLAQDGYALWHAHLGVTRGPLRVSAWVRNLGDRDYLQEGFDQGTFFVNLLVPGEPRVWGLSVSATLADR